MVELTCLWLPILLSAVAVFFLSFVMWMVLPHHRKDWGQLPDEKGAQAALGDIPAGQYMFPFCASPEQMKDPEWIKTREAGPSGLMIIMPRGPISMGKALAQSFVFNLLIAIVTAYVATIGLRSGSSFMDVFRLTATVAFIACAGALGWNAIWFHHSWSSTLKSVFDGLVYGIATGVLFAVLWPAGGGGWDADAAL
jgi:hypothetical protein